MGIGNIPFNCLLHLDNVEPHGRLTLAIIDISSSLISCMMLYLMYFWCFMFFACMQRKVFWFTVVALAQNGNFMLRLHVLTVFLHFSNQSSHQTDPLQR